MRRAVLGALIAMPLSACAVGHGFIPPPSSGQPSAGLSGLALTAQGSPKAPGAPLAFTSTAPQPAEPAKLELAIRWPQRSPTAYAAQNIPLSTQAIVVSVWQGPPGGSGTSLLASRTVLRPASGNVSPVSFSLSAANNVSVQIQAFRNAGSPPTDLVAQGSVAGLNLVSSQIATASCGLTPLDVPTISALSTNLGQPGDAITLTGTNLLPFAGASVSVQFSGVSGSWLAAPVQVESSSSLTVAVPQGAASGKILVEADGVPSAGSATFWVPASLGLAVADATPSWDALGPGSFPVLFGHAVGLAATTRWQLPAGLANASVLGLPPTPTLGLSGAGALGPVSTVVSGAQQVATASFTAATSYSTGTVTATLGSLASNQVQLTSDGVASVKVFPAQVALGAAAVPTASFDAWNVMSDGSTNSAVDFLVSDPASLSLSASLGQAVASVSDFASYGPVLVTARSNISPTLSAAATATLTTYQVTTLAGSGTYGQVDGSGVSAEFEQPTGIVLDAHGDLIVSDYAAIRKVTTAGQVTTLAGNGSLGNVDGPAASARFNDLTGVAVDSSGNILVADYNNKAIRVLSPGGSVTSQNMSSLGLAANVTLAPGGQEYVNIDGGSPQIDLLTPAGLTPWLAGTAGDDTITQTLLSSTILQPFCVTFDPAGTPYILGRANGYVYKVVNGAPVRVGGRYQGFNYPRTDGPFAPENATFNHPNDMVFDAAGNLYVTDTETLSDSHGQTTISDAIRRISPAGWVSTIAGGSRGSADGIGTAASFDVPYGIAVDANGDIFVADSLNNRIRELRKVP